ncbi:phosphatidate cytidylyltransferase [Chryseobacterium sp. BIGb0232]|uniref:phosphatidate cytidylyltransferase n=1 Tax=Chryseobacterium sp. BIGb0232 TaxID=2940598 RepID=UPI000F4773C6|nr:phosphatidate cytidylyltransferase [Chryseobacterium sp. BIGb0232]MCS4303359.1 phosphatidate cytidylyltransferase [Chryseobacterium sp. BIGb0232]ROS11370.1 phosphatidate cytidylyltransferase [Chryseobacterium nakagawai]
MKPEENKFADVPLRVKTWIYIIIVFALGISHPLAMTIFISWISFQAFFELSRMLKVVNPVNPAIFIGIAQFLLLYFFNIEYYFLYSSILGATVFLYFLIVRASVQQLYGILIALLVCLFAFPHLLWIRCSSNGLSSIIFIVVVTELNDVFQYLMGKFFGKHKIVPKISPNKTREGLIGGIFLTVILSNILGSFLLKTGIFTNSIIGIALGISGFCGDIFMSYLKRKTEVKDTGTLLPGHGGLLDRMDSLIFNAPLFFWILSFLIKN